MIVVLPAAKMLNAILKPQKFDADVDMRPIAFCVQTKTDQGILLYNTLTKELLFLTQHELEASKEVRQYLVEHRFLVPDGHDDCRLAEEIREIIGLQVKRQMDDRINSYTILPTTGCNARCFYCYEEGVKPVRMTEQTADEVVEYIVRHCGGEKVTIHWFGGEPLLNPKAISRICKGLSNKGIPYCSKMITNGFLYDEQLIDTAARDWHTVEVQITLDGTETVYNKRKDYVCPGASPFFRVLQNISMLLERGIYVRIRMNMDQENEGDLYALSDQLQERFGRRKNMTVYVRLISPDDIPTAEIGEMNRRLFQLERYISQRMNLQTAALDRMIKVSQCMADNPYSVLILPDGALHSCDYLANGRPWGHVSSDTVDTEAYQYFRQQAPVTEACQICPHYPNCFRLTCCPSFAEGCTESIRCYYDRAMEQAMLQHWEKYIALHQEDDTGIEVPNC